MNTVITRNIDGHEVVKGFSKLAVDGVATTNVVSAAIIDTAEFKAAEEVQGRLIASDRLANEKQREAGKQHKLGNKKGAQDIWNDSEIIVRQSKQIEEELKPLVEVLKSKKQSMRSEKAVYFEPPLGEVVKTEAEIADLKEKVASGQGFVCLDGSVLADNRGVVFCEHHGDGQVGGWMVTKISTIGVDIPVGAILYGDLTSDQKQEVDLQIEIDTAADMTPELRVLVKADKTEKALNEAAVMRSKLQISGAVDDPLVASQEWYDDKLKELEVIYG